MHAHRSSGQRGCTRGRTCGPGPSLSRPLSGLAGELMRGGGNRSLTRSDSEFRRQIAVWCAFGYAAAAACAWSVWVVCERSGNADPEQLVSRHRECAAAYLRGEDEAALGIAREMVRMAPRHPGCWRLLAMAAEACQRQADVDRAMRQYHRLERLRTAGG